MSGSNSHWEAARACARAVAVRRFGVELDDAVALATASGHYVDRDGVAMCPKCGVVYCHAMPPVSPWWELWVLEHVIEGDCG